MCYCTYLPPCLTQNGLQTSFLFTPFHITRAATHPSTACLRSCCTSRLAMPTGKAPPLLNAQNTSGRRPSGSTAATKSSSARVQRSRGPRVGQKMAAQAAGGGQPTWASRVCSRFAGFRVGLGGGCSLGTGCTAGASMHNTLPRGAYQRWDTRRAQWSSPPRSGAKHFQVALLAPDPPREHLHRTCTAHQQRWQREAVGSQHR